VRLSTVNKVLIAAVLLALVAAAILIFAGASIQRSFFYPKAGPLPQIVSASTTELLAKLESVLNSHAPAVVPILKPGLTDAEISTMQKKGGFSLSDDLKALYRWHNGMGTNGGLGLLPGIRFLPLEEAVQQRAMVQEEVAASSIGQRAAFKIFAGHRKTWVHILDDGAGDGFFYDPTRSDSEGAFFEHMGEIQFYRWFPSLRNFLAGVIQCYEKGAIKAGKDGNMEVDAEEEEKIWTQFSISIGI
jgi:cell wall assembly regulator SMI1